MNHRKVCDKVKKLKLSADDIIVVTTSDKSFLRLNVLEALRCRLPHKNFIVIVTHGMDIRKLTKDEAKHLLSLAH